MAGYSLVMLSKGWRMPQEDEELGAVFSTDPTGYFPEMFHRVDGEFPSSLSSLVAAKPQHQKRKHLRM